MQPSINDGFARRLDAAQEEYPRLSRRSLQHVGGFRFQVSKSPCALRRELFLLVHKAKKRAARVRVVGERSDGGLELPSMFSTARLFARGGEIITHARRATLLFFAPQWSEHCDLFLDFGEAAFEQSTLRHQVLVPLVTRLFSRLHLCLDDEERAHVLKLALDESLNRLRLAGRDDSPGRRGEIFVSSQSAELLDDVTARILAHATFRRDTILAAGCCALMCEVFFFGCFISDRMSVRYLYI